MSLSSIKITVRKYLPAFIFDAGLSVWRATVQKLLLWHNSRQSESFTKSQIVNLTYQDSKFKIIIDPDNGFIDQYIYTHGIYEDYILDLIATHLPQNGVFFDIGANIGHHSLFAAAHLENKGTVYAFEPVPNLYAQFRKSAELNKFSNIQIYNYACGNSENIQSIAVNNKNLGQSSLIEMESAQKSISIQVKKLDDVFPNIPVINVMKIDVEGFEYEVLLGASNVIAKTKPAIILEYSPCLYDTFDSAVSTNILDYLFVHYKIIDIDDGGNEVHNTEDYVKEFYTRNRTQTNLLCLPK